MGYLDEDGYLYISGRENHMILYGGINIFPEEIETILSSHKNVDMVAVVGIVDSYWGQMITAVVKGSASKKELRGLCREKLSSYKVPRKWCFVEEMPLMSSGKIDRVQIKDMIERKLVRL
jgi:long-chain acyl-CoA synthetase